MQEMSLNNITDILTVGHCIHFGHQDGIKVGGVIKIFQYYKA